jgi:hypothetical protein
VRERNAAVKRFTKRSLCFALLATATACGRNHDGLALKDPGTGSAAGSGGLGGSGGSGGRGRGGSGTGGVATGGVGGKYVEPPGRSVTTFVHGIVDAERIVFCFARHDEADPVLVGNPSPSGGLAYAASFSVETLRGIDLETEPVLPYAIAGDLGLVADMNCEQAVETARTEMEAETGLPLGAGGSPGGGGEAGAGGTAEPPEPPRLRVSSLPEIPAGALAEGYSSLYVATGCLGGPAFTHGLETDACGSNYEPNEPTASAVLVTLSRITGSGKLVFQALHASLASPTLAVSSSPPDTAVQATIPIVYDLRRGALSPRIPAAILSLSDSGIEQPGWRAQASNEGTVLVSELWPDVLDRAGFDTLEEGRTYTLVVVGPRGNLGANNGFWNEAAIGVVDNDPLP